MSVWRVARTHVLGSSRWAFALLLQCRPLPSSSPKIVSASREFARRTRAICALHIISRSDVTFRIVPKVGGFVISMSQSTPAAKRQRTSRTMRLTVTEVRSETMRCSFLSVLCSDRGGFVDGCRFGELVWQRDLCSILFSAGGRDLQLGAERNGRPAAQSATHGAVGNLTILGEIPLAEFLSQRCLTRTSSLRYRARQSKTQRTYQPMAISTTRPGAVLS